MGVRWDKNRVILRADGEDVSIIDTQKTIEQSTGTVKDIESSIQDALSSDCSGKTRAFYIHLESKDLIGLVIMSVPAGTKIGENWHNRLPVDTKEFEHGPHRS